MIAQVALSAVLLAGAGLFLRTLQNARSDDVTMRPEKVLVAKLDTAILGYNARRSQAFYSQVLDRVKALRGVDSAALVQLLPLGGSRGGMDIEVGGRKVQVDFNVATPEYFDTIGLPLLRGRTFTDSDREGAPAVAE